MTVGERIHEFRTFRRCVDQKEFTELIGLKNCRSLQNWEHNRSIPSLPVFDKMLKVLNITYEEFMKGVEM